MRGPVDEPTIGDMDDDLIQKRRERLTPAGKELLDEMVEKLEAHTSPVEDKDVFLSRMEALPPSDCRELAIVFQSLMLGLNVRIQEDQEGLEVAEGAVRVFEAAHEKLRSEGKPIDPEMTLGEAYEVLGLTGESDMEERVGRTYSIIWRNKFLTTDAETIEEMVGELEKAAVELREMYEAGVKLAGGAEDDYAMLTTTDQTVAARFGFEEEEAEK